MIQRIAKNADIKFVSQMMQKYKINSSYVFTPLTSQRQL